MDPQQWAYMLMGLGQPDADVDHFAQFAANLGMTPPDPTGGQPGMPPGTPAAMASLGGDGGLGGILSMLGGGDAGAGGPPPITPPGTPTPAPMQGNDLGMAQAQVTGQQPGQTPKMPNIRMPQAPKPVFSGGVAGAQKAPDAGVKAGVSPAQALMQAILGNRGGAKPQTGGGGLGAILGGQ